MFQLNLTSGEAIYQQLKEQVVRLALIGALEPGEQLPSVRVLARELGINPNTVSKAYQELENDGVVYSVAGKGNFVAEDLRQSSGLHRSTLEDFQKIAIRARQAGIAKQELNGVLTIVYERE